ncbi:LuxR family transcriptional regulator [Streptomyces sp. WAC05292]|uniref:LuxR C-terminal-related transcriptional regulator n=1 Tax=Streptomyces sp. WAC05292 TaxID=2487418 RepID=UPI000F73EE84|nr:LuxR family transcriptional regulator [Streptomyces sp. WAC05292]RSS92345.1 LuxR family transcriptional regulator [Streptomyces sp. WAC05292]
MSALTALYGRERELRRLGDFLDRAAHGHPELLVVGGQAGVGKSRLLLDAAHRARRRGFTVLQHHGSELRGSAGAALRDAVGQAGPPPLIVVDDAEPGSADTLFDLIRSTGRAARPPVPVLLARSASTGGLDPAAEASWEGAGGPPAAGLELAPLDGEAVRELVADLLAVAPQPALLDVAACANGNPRLIVELLEGLREEGRISPDGELVRVTPGRLPARVQAAVAGLLRQLSRESAQLLRVGTVLGRTFQLSQAAAMLGTSTAALLPALDETLTTGVLRLTDEGVTFQQPLLWRAVFEAIPPSVRSTLHEEARRLVPGHDLPARDLASLGRQGAARAKPGSAADDGAGVTGALATLLGSGYVESALLLARSALNGPLPRGEAATLRRVVLDLVMVGTGGAPDGFGPVGAEQARAAVDRLHDGGPEARRAAATALAGLRWSEGRVGEALRSGAAAVGQPVTPDTAAERAYPRVAQARRLICAGEPDAARALVARVLADTPAGPLAVFGPAAGLVRAEAHVRAGELAEAEHAAREVLAVLDAREAAAAGGPATLQAWALSTLCRVAVRRGDTAGAAAQLARLREFGPEVTELAPVPAAWLELVLAHAQGEHLAATALLTGPGRHLPSLRPLHLAEPGAAAWFVRFSRTAGNPEPGQAALRTAELLAAANPDIPSLQTAALHARALFECDPDGLTRAAAEHTDAWAAACAASDLRTLLGERGSSAAGRGRTWLVREHAGRYAVVDTAREPVGAEAGVAGWEELGGTERTIAALVADGLTNGEVAGAVHLSPHTVNYYLRRIYAKLGIHSRVELARLALSAPRRMLSP